jgi:hypothetical protein
MLTSSAKVVQGYVPETTPRRVLLFNPPVYDTRFPWSRWQQPVTLLQLATLLRHLNVYIISQIEVSLAIV